MYVCVCVILISTVTSRGLQHALMLSVTISVQSEEVRDLLALKIYYAV